MTMKRHSEKANVEVENEDQDEIDRKVKSTGLSNRIKKGQTISQW